MHNSNPRGLVSESGGSAGVVGDRVRQPCHAARGGGAGAHARADRQDAAAPQRPLVAAYHQMEHLNVLF